MDMKEFYEQERISLRQELHNLKSCQITFLTTSVTASGLLLGLATTFASKIDLGRAFGIVFLLPLIVLLPFWWVFFDKATSITRIVGYYRILERLILDRCKTARFIGWENAIGDFRRGQFEQPKGQHISFSYSRLGKLLLLQTSHKYWVISYYIYFALSAVCVVTSASLLRREAYLLILLVVPFALFFLISAHWNIKVVWQLIDGPHSYDLNEYYWEQVLEIEPRAFSTRQVNNS